MISKPKCLASQRVLLSLLAAHRCRSTNCPYLCSKETLLKNVQFRQFGTAHKYYLHKPNLDYDTSKHSLLGTKLSYYLDCEETDSEGYEDVDENEVPEFVKHTEAMFDEIDISMSFSIFNLFNV